MMNTTANPNAVQTQSDSANASANANATPKSGSKATAREDRALRPPVDVAEDATGITLYADLPGVSRDRLNLRVEGDTLSIEGDLLLQTPQDMRASHAEIGQARYRRSFTLSKELDASKIAAELSQGVLRVRIPKAEHAQPRRIEVSVA